MVTLMTRREAADKVKEHKHYGTVVGLATGCFDILHIGHIRMFQDAKDRGIECLLVGVNTDTSVARLKGQERPRFKLHERLEVLSALRLVDALVVFSEATPIRLIEEIKPHVFVKGTDYHGKTLPESDVCAEVGTEIIFAGDPKTRSSTELLDHC